MKEMHFYMTRKTQSFTDVTNIDCLRKEESSETSNGSNAEGNSVSGSSTSIAWWWAVGWGGLVLWWGWVFVDWGGVNWRSWGVGWLLWNLSDDGGGWTWAVSGGDGGGIAVVLSWADSGVVGVGVDLAAGAVGWDWVLSWDLSWVNWGNVFGGVDWWDIVSVGWDWVVGGTSAGGDGVGSGGVGLSWAGDDIVGAGGDGDLLVRGVGDLGDWVVGWGLIDWGAGGLVDWGLSWGGILVRAGLDGGIDGRGGAVVDWLLVVAGESAANGSRSSNESGREMHFD
ncbi:hypothetical protein ABW19_dt0206829 [Dactylella cylindrospora]|nr:hypothetical protein ABW19_dt0206829 [Dactylella cylindrospora]